MYKSSFVDKYWTFEEIYERYKDAIFKVIIKLSPQHLIRSIYSIVDICNNIYFL